jgi:hypothetical protein
MQLVWSDPKILGAAIFFFFLFFRILSRIVREIQFRTNRRRKAQRETRYLLSHYRAKYSKDSIPQKLEEDLDSCRRDMERLAARWKLWQMHREEAFLHGERQHAEAEEQKAYTAYLQQAHRYHRLCEVYELLMHRSP